VANTGHLQSSCFRLGQPSSASVLPLCNCSLDLFLCYATSVFNQPPHLSSNLQIFLSFSIFTPLYHLISLQADPPDFTSIPPDDIVGVTVILLTCSYKNQVRGNDWLPGML
jgi:hypothetical protein